MLTTLFFGEIGIETDDAVYFGSGDPYGSSNMKLKLFWQISENMLRTMQNMPVPGPDVGDANRLKVYRTGDTDRLG